MLANQENAKLSQNSGSTTHLWDIANECQIVVHLVGIVVAVSCSVRSTSQIDGVGTRQEMQFFGGSLGVNPSTYLPRYLVIQRNS